MSAIKIAIIIILVLIIIYLISTYIMFILVSKKFKKSQMPIIDKAVEETLKPYKEVREKGIIWTEERIKNASEEVYITSNDNLKLHGILIKNEKQNGILIECHGYRSTAKRDLYPSVFEYYNMGYSVLLIDQRTSNKSEGKYITFGIKESDDLINWCKYVNEKFPGTKVILGGVSMGSATILMAMKNITSEMNVKAVIADCGYVSAWEEVKYCIRHYFKLPGKLFIGMIDIWCRIFAKFSLKDKNTIECMKDSDIPVLLVHGEEDDFVPTYNSKKIFETYKGKKELLIIPKATHGISYLVDREKYIENIKKILE